MFSTRVLLSGDEPTRSTGIVAILCEGTFWKSDRLWRLWKWKEGGQPIGSSLTNCKSYKIPTEMNMFRIVSLLATSAWTSSWTWSCCTPSSWESTTGWPPSWGGWTPGGATRPSTRLAGNIFVARSNFVFTGSEEDQRGRVSAYCLQGVASHHHW